MRRQAFTLIELMIVVAIIGVLAAIAIPKFAALINKSKEGHTKGALATVRSALSVYYADNEGVFPLDDLSCLTANAKYIASLPRTQLPNTPHADSYAIAAASSLGAMLTEAGGWAYLNDRQAAGWGQFMVNCSHADAGGVVWSNF